MEWIDGDLPKFALVETSLTGLILSLGLQSVSDTIRLNELSADDYSACTVGVQRDGLVDVNSTSEYRVPTACADKVAPYKIGIAPDNEFTREYFMEAMTLWYPRVSVSNTSEALQIPSFEESVQFFDTPDALQDYVKSDNYGKGIANPRIYAAIVFDEIPSSDAIGSFASIEYSLRLNSTAGDDNAGRVPRTNGDLEDLYPFQKKIDTTYYSRYTLTGFMTLQTLVTRFVTCMPEWDSTNKSTTGVCQRSQSTAEASTDLDYQLLATLVKDALIQEALSSIPELSGNSSMSSFSGILAGMPDESKELLLTPLRQAPQSYLGNVVAPFPVEAYVSSPFYDQVKDVFAVVFVLAYLSTVSRILVIFIQEKESRMREFMKILGVHEKAIIITWYLTYTAIIFIGAVLQAIAGLAGLFQNSSPIVVFLFFFLFGMSVLAFAFLISTLFSKARAGSFVGMVLFFLMYFVSQGFSTRTPETAKSIDCILSPVGLSFGVTVFADAEATGQGIGLRDVTTLSNNFRISIALWMFMLDTVVYTLLSLYFEKVIPKDYSTTLKWYFPLSPSYWRSRRHGVIAETQDALLDNVTLDVNPNFEPVNSELREQERQGEVLSVQRLRKVFSVPGGEKVAVRGLNMVMYKNQITCLLGHNGAGKTTLISMLTGMTSPSSGNASYRGLSLIEDMDEIRRSLGICFQHDVLFNELTVKEHLLFFGQMKGYSNAELTTVTENQIREVGLTENHIRGVGLTEKRHVKSCELSGGMKRKLSVAVSLLGDSSLVFLDEPTSGMDLYSRRSTWEILLNNRNDRVMVLTTHFMDEADILGDRIAIMSEGELRCCGSSLFLKNRFGAGYNLTLVKDDATCKDSDVIAFVTSRVPTAQLLSNVGSEIAFQLPLASSSQFASMFADMDDNLQELGLLSYGVSVTTLEEVFIKVAEADDEDNQHTLHKDARLAFTPVPSPTASVASYIDDEPAPSSLFVTHLYALLLKRFRYARRDKKMLFLSTGLPIFLLVAGLGILKASGVANDDPLIPLTTEAFTADGSSLTPYYCEVDTGDSQWCSGVMSTSHFTGASTQELSISQPAFTSSSPTVFDVTYSDPAINSTNATGYGLRLGQEVYNRGYGLDTPTVEEQYGTFLVYGESDRNLFAYNTFVNTSATHASVIFKALMDQAIYRFFAANTTDATSDVSLKVNNYPLPMTASTEAFLGSVLAFVSCMFICIAFTYFPASIVVFLVREKQSEHNSKHQQLVSDVSLSAFWMANYIWDLLMYVVPCVAALVLIYGFNISAMTGSDCSSCTSMTFPAVTVLFVFFGLAICPFTYCLSNLFKEHAASQTYTIMINFMVGVVLMVLSFILNMLDSTEGVNSVFGGFHRSLIWGMAC